jgi:glycosyltransferase involved in cell wall biosynthesis
VPALRSRGFDPSVATLRHRGRYFDQLRDQNVPMAFADMRSRFGLRGGRRAYRLWRDRPEIVFSSSIDAQVIGHAIARRAGAAHVTAEHGGAGIPRAWHRRALVRLIAPRVERVIAVSSSQLEELRGLGYRTERITVIPNGIPEPAVTRTSQSVRDEIGVGADDVVALFVATLRPEKRAPRFVESVIRAHASDPRLRGVVVGAGPELERVRALAATAPGVVQVLGERRDVGDLIGAADVVCLASTFEGLPMIVLEAMALGRPVVSTDVGGIPDAVVPGETGWLVPPADDVAYAAALVAIAGDPAERAALGSGAKRAFSTRYTLEAMTDAYAETLAAVARSPTGSRSPGARRTR